MVGKSDEKSRRVTEFIILRRKEEHEFKKAGNPKWREQAEANFLSRMKSINKELNIEKEKPRMISSQISIEEESKIVEDVFGFLNELNSPPQINRSYKKPSFNVSKLLTYFEEKSKSFKKIPSKLLSQPVKFYDGSDFQHYHKHSSHTPPKPKPNRESYRNIL